MLFAGLDSRDTAIVGEWLLRERKLLLHGMTAAISYESFTHILM
jgi:hypothetical protein